MRKYIGLISILATLNFISCQKELAEIQLELNQCRIIRGDYYGGGGMHDSADFIYDNQGKLIKWVDMDGRYDYYYSGNNITARIFTENSGSILWVDSVSYNSENSISQIVFYDFSGWYTPDTLHNKVIFYYQNGRVSNLENVEYYDAGFGPQTDTTFTTVFWNAAGNIEKILSINNGYIGFEDSVLYQYDVNPNYFKPIHPHFFLFDPGFELHVGFEPHLAYFYSKNNVSNFNVYGNWDYPIVYGLDSTKKVTKLNMGGFPYMEYKYECH